ncbi:hypothetical protein MAMP_02089 [Methylophaga aminisulfidivorans MP]|uniref:Uncharacterized protein n=1 Tax=Methylophaga aminisulfidivorans MP TaxID=1026882 RepID=F5SXG3_9GAMM|nr:hypothetical protein MAMP_02089 [Methylophaga aminisulfidivorans MP]
MWDLTTSALNISAIVQTSATSLMLFHRPVKTNFVSFNGRYENG